MNILQPENVQVQHNMKFNRISRAEKVLCHLTSLFYFNIKKTPEKSSTLNTTKNKHLLYLQIRNNVLDI